MISDSCQIPKGKFGIPLIRENIKFAKDPDAYIEHQIKTFGNVSKTHILGAPTIIVVGKKYVDYVLENENINFTCNFPKSFRLLLGNSLSTQHGVIHRNRRRVISKAFQVKQLKSYRTRLEEITQIYLDKWSKLETFNLYSELKKYSFDIACEFLIGKSDLASSSVFQDYECWSAGFFSIPVRTPFSRFDKAKKSRKRIEAFIKRLQENPSLNTTNLLSILIENKLEAEEITDQILMLLYAGHGTLASALWMVCYQLYANPNYIEDIQQRLNEKSGIESIDNYIEAIIHECLRIEPPIGGGFRKITETNNFSGYTFPKDWNVIYQIRETELDTTRYEQPEIFKPERFFDAKGYKNLAFGGGPRECIGKELAKLELFIFVKTLLQGYEWSFENINNVKLSRIPVTHPETEILTRFKKK